MKYHKICTGKKIIRIKVHIRVYLEVRRVNIDCFGRVGKKSSSISFLPSLKGNQKTWKKATELEETFAYHT